MIRFTTARKRGQEKEVFDLTLSLPNLTTSSNKRGQEGYGTVLLHVASVVLPLTSFHSLLS